MNPFKAPMDRLRDQWLEWHAARHPHHLHHGRHCGHGDPFGHEHRHAGRHGGRGRHGFFGFGADFGHDFPGGRGAGAFGPGRKLGSADLQLLLLALLAERPSHGYELIKALDERSNGYYSPSPGMVYPALTYLEEIGHATVQTEGTKKLYSITDAGRAHLEQNRAAVDTLIEQLQWLGRKMDHLRRAMSGGASDADDVDDARGRHRGAPELRSARHALKAALFEKADAPLDEQRRVAAILERALTEIRGGKSE